MSAFNTVYRMVSDAGLCCFCLIITVFYSQLLEAAAADGVINQIPSGLILKYPEVRAFKTGGEMGKRKQM